MERPSRPILGALLGALALVAGCGERPAPPAPDLAWLLAVWVPGTTPGRGRVELELDLVNPTDKPIEAAFVTLALPRVGEHVLELGDLGARGQTTWATSRERSGAGDDPAGLSLVLVGGEGARPRLTAFPRVERLSLSYRRGGKTEARDLTDSVNARMAGWLEAAGRAAESWEARARRRREALGVPATPYTTMK